MAIFFDLFCPCLWPKSIGFLSKTLLAHERNQLYKSLLPQPLSEPNPLTLRVQTPPEMVLNPQNNPKHLLRRCFSHFGPLGLVFEPTFQDLFLAKTLLHLILHFLLRPTKGAQPLQKPLRYRRAQNRRLEHVPLRDVDDPLTKGPSWPVSFLSTCFNSICCFSSRGS